MCLGKGGDLNLLERIIYDNILGHQPGPEGTYGPDVCVDAVAGKAVRRLRPFIQKARERGVTVIWLRAAIAADRMRPSYKARPVLGSNLLAKEGSDGANWYSEVIKPLPGEYIITKRHYDAFEDTELHLLLRSIGIKTLVFTGFSSSVCVETSARHGYIKEFYIILASDCTDAPTQQEYESAVFNI